MMPHPTEQYGQMVVDSAEPFVLSSNSLAAASSGVNPIAPAATAVPPEIFKKSLLEISMRYLRFL
jgi:hypothetical protein